MLKLTNFKNLNYDIDWLEYEFKKAVENGNMVAMYNLGNLYYLGEETEKNRL